jgi:hypothetical protein
MKIFSQYFEVKNKELFDEINRKEEVLDEIIPTLMSRG